MKLKRNVLLKNYTTFKIGGPVKYFYIVKTKTELIEAIKRAKNLRLPFFVLGEGSNLLVSDKGYKGVVIKFQNQSAPPSASWRSGWRTKFQILNSKIISGAGVTLTELVSVSAKTGLSGLEWVAGIPGTVGGAIRGNAGAFKKSMVDIVKTVEVLNSENLETKIFKNKDCKLGYRDSIFKKKKNLIILSATFQLKKGNKKVIKNKIKKNLEQRKQTQPSNFPSAGSIFKNYESRIMNNELVKEFPELREFNKNNLIPAGYLIEKCGLKGKKIGKVKISEKHANFILNLGQGKAKDVIKLIKLIKKKVKNKFRVNLEEEIQFLGFAHLTNFLEMKK